MANEMKEKPAVIPADKSPENPASGSPDNTAAKPAGDAQAKSSARRRGPRTNRRDDRPAGQQNGQPTDRQGAERDRPQAARQENRRSAPQDERRNNRRPDPAAKTSRTPKTPAPARPRTAAPRWTWRDYALQFSVVFLGVLVTLIGSGLVERWTQKRDEKEVMKLVVEELRENRRQVLSCTEKLIHERNGLLMFGRYEYAVDRIPLDSLRNYDQLWSMRELVTMSDAVEVLKNSDFFSSIGDKELVMRILGCYAGLGNFRANIALYNAFKFDALKHFYASGKDIMAPIVDIKDDWKVMMEDAMCRSFIRNGVNFFGDENFLRRDIAGLERVISAIYEKYGFE